MKTDGVDLFPIREIIDIEHPVPFEPMRAWGQQPKNQNGIATCREI